MRQFDTLYAIFPKLVVRWNGVAISSLFRDIALYAYWGHEFDFSGLCDVVDQVTI